MDLSKFLIDDDFLSDGEKKEPLAAVLNPESIKEEKIQIEKTIEEAPKIVCSSSDKVKVPKPELEKKVEIKEPIQTRKITRSILAALPSINVKEWE